MLEGRRRVGGDVGYAENKERLGSMSGSNARAGKREKIIGRRNIRGFCGGRGGRGEVNG